MKKKSQLNKGKLLFLLAFLLFSTHLFAQQVTVTGTISSMTDDSPIPGVNILEKGTSNGTITNGDGEYEITVSGSDAVLVLSCIGHLSETVEVNNRTTIDFSLAESLTELDDVVVIGYGTVKKVDLVGSVSEVEGEDLIKAPTPDLRQSLAGKLTGVITKQSSGTPGFEEQTIVVRGRGTVNSIKPLVLVDGIAREDWERIDPHDIASMTVLKDAASTAIYGARAANGVILITTKRGESGKPKISYRSSFGIQQPTVMLDLLDGADYATWYNHARINAKDGDTAKVFGLYTEEQIEQFRNGELPTTDWIENAFPQNGATQSHSLSATGGTEKNRYFMSLGYMNQDGMYELSNFKRYNARLNLDSKITEHIEIGMDFAGRIQDATRSPESETNLWQKVLNSTPLFPDELPDSLQGLGAHSFSGFNGNPNAWANHSGEYNVKKSFLESTYKAKVDIPWVEGLSLNGRFSFDMTEEHDKMFQHGYPVYKYDVFTDSWNPLSDNITPELSEFKKSTTNRSSLASINYIKSFGAHNINAIALMEREYTRKDKLFATRTGFITNSVPYLFAGNPDMQTNGGIAEEGAREGWVGRVDYNYAQKYYVQVNGRYDGSHKFKPGDKFGLFPSASAAWRISEEKFMAGLTWLENLKIRASHGVLGNDNLLPFQYLEGFELDRMENRNQDEVTRGYLIGSRYYLGIRDRVPPNEAVTWERTATSNLGLDVSLFDGRLYFEGDVYKRSTTMMLVKVEGTVPLYHGFAGDLPKMNAGEMEVKGIEGLLRYKERLGDFSFAIEGNATYAKDKVIDIAEGDKHAGVLVTGRRYKTEFGYESAGLFVDQEEIDNWTLDQDLQGNSTLKPGDIKYVDQDGNDTLDYYDQVPIGNTTIPTFTYGMNLKLEYKGIGLTAFFQGVSGIDREIRLKTPFHFDGMNTIYEVVENSWTPENPDGNAKYPRIEPGGRGNNQHKSDFWMHNGAFIRLKNLQIDYTFKHDWVNKIGVDDLSIHVSGTNLWFWAHEKWQDAEVQESHLGVSPLMKSYNFGVNLTF